MARLTSRLSYANVTATLALFVALGGVSYAAITLPVNSVGSKQIKRGAVKNSDLGTSAVTTGKVKDFSLLSKDFKPGQLPAGATGAPGATGPQGPTGATGGQGSIGAMGARGPSDTYHAEGANPLTISLPVGRYVIAAKADTFTLATTGGPFAINCTLSDGSDSDQSSATVPNATASASVNYSEATLSNLLTHSSTAPDTVTYSCDELTSTVGIYDTRMVATEVGALHP